jgi:hypothetical protein
MRLLKQASPYVAGAVAFLAVMLLMGPLRDAVSHGLFKTTTFPDGKPPAAFMLVAYDPSAAASGHPYSYYRWSQVAGRKLTLLLPDRRGEKPGDGDHYAFKVLEEQPDTQVVEVFFANTVTSWSRYAAHADRMAPISYRTDGGWLLLIPMAMLLIAAWFAGRWAKRLVAKKLDIA